MNSLDGNDFFDNIRRSVKISHFVASIIPLALLVYFSIKYVYPYVTAGDAAAIPADIGILLLLAVAVSVLGLLLSTKATNSSIASAQNLTKKINSLFSITKQFRETLHSDALLEQIMKSSIDLTAAESGSLFLYNEEGMLQEKINTGDNGKKTGSRSDKGVASMVAESGVPVLISNVLNEIKNNPEFSSKNSCATGTMICMPLIYFDETIGVIELRNSKPGMFTKQDEALLYSLANQASISIAHNRSNEIQLGDFIHITEIIIGAQDYMENKKGHARRVANYANHIARNLNFSEIELKKLYYACLLHDIGMLKIDASKHCEREKFIHHPRLGHDLIKSISLWSDAADVILHHHERYDGRGYPSAKKEEDIPLSARILFVADTFDVLTSKYSYRMQMDRESAIREIEANAGTQFDPAVVQTLKSCITDTDIVLN